MQPHNDTTFLHNYLFTGSRDDVHKLLEIELKNHHDSKIVSIGNVLIPQLCGNLKSEILKNIESKTLTEQHISLAPSISYQLEFFLFNIIHKINQLIFISLFFFVDFG